MRKFLWFFVGVLLLPVCAATSRTVLSLAAAAQRSPGWILPAPALAVAAGYGLWMAVFFLMPKPMRTYVLAHELTHALWAWVMGKRVHSMKIARDGGQVSVSESNVLITLAPYFFPLYTVLVVSGYYVLGLAMDVSRYHLFWLGMVGFTWGFHFTFTLMALMQHQEDIREYGRLFSYAFIYLANVLGICLWVVMVSDATLLQFGSFWLHDLRVWAAWSFDAGVWLWDGIRTIIGGARALSGKG